MNWIKVFAMQTYLRMLLVFCLYVILQYKKEKKDNILKSAAKICTPLFGMEVPLKHYFK